MKIRGEAIVLKHPLLFQMLETLGLTPNLPRTPGIIAGWYGPGWQSRWSVTEDILEYIVQDFRERGIGDEIILAFMPSPFQTEPVFHDLIANRLDEDERYALFLEDMDRPQRLLAEFCRENNVPFVDLTAALRRAVGPYFPSEGHLNEYGSEIVADVLYQTLRDAE